jgi:hypothetical protein
MATYQNVLQNRTGSRQLAETTDTSVWQTKPSATVLDFPQMSQLISYTSEFLSLIYVSEPPMSQLGYKATK